MNTWATSEYSTPNIILHQFLVFRIGGTLKAMNDTKLIKEVTQTHLGSSWHHSEPSEVSYSTNKKLYLYAIIWSNSNYDIFFFNLQKISMKFWQAIFSIDFLFHSIFILWYTNPKLPMLLLQIWKIWNPIWAKSQHFF